MIQLDADQGPVCMDSVGQPAQARDDVVPMHAHLPLTPATVDAHVGRLGEQERGSAPSPALQVSHVAVGDGAVQVAVVAPSGAKRPGAQLPALPWSAARRGVGASRPPRFVPFMAAGTVDRLWLFSRSEPIGGNPFNMPLVQGVEADE